MSLSDLIDAMYFRDFASSTRILCEQQDENALTPIAYALRQESEGGIRNPLVIRDHIFHFLDGFPVYTALNIPSYEILEVIADSTTQNEARTKFLNFVEMLFKEKDTRFFDHFIEIEDLANNSFMSIIADLLQQRKDEIYSIKIPYSTTRIADSVRKRYYISELTKTAYGHKILATLGASFGSAVVGESVWKKIEQMLENLGYDLSQIVHNIDETAWARLTTGIGSKSYGNSELEELDLLRQAVTNLNSHELDSRISGLRQMQQIRSVYHLEKIAMTARNGSIEERCIAIDILGEVGPENYESILGPMLNDKNVRVRARAAHAISRQSARGFLRDSYYAVEGSKPLSKHTQDEIMTSIDIEVKNRYERMDLAKIYLHLDSKNAIAKYNLLYDQMDSRTKHDLLNYTFELKRKRAEIVIKRALKDDDLKVREAAFSIGRQIWPGSHWDNEFAEIDE